MDDISLKTDDGSCVLDPLAATPLDRITTTQSPQTIPTTTEASILELDCNFESACSWKNDPTNRDVDWLIQSANNPVSNFAPDTDHTYAFMGSSKGSYLTLDSLLFFRNSIVGYESAYMNGTKCVEFWYYMYGTSVLVLNLISTFKFY